MRIDQLVTSGKFKLDGNEWDVDNNVFIVGDQDCWIIDPSHEFDTIVGAVENRNVKGIILTHGHSDHVDIAPQVADHFGVECTCTQMTKCCGKKPTAIVHSPVLPTATSST